MCAIEQRAARLVERLQAEWLASPTFDVELVEDEELSQDEREELAAWHQDQIAQRAALLGCSALMAAIVEELARCWLDGTAPLSAHARRVLKAFG